LIHYYTICPYTPSSVRRFSARLLLHWAKTELVSSLLVSLIYFTSLVEALDTMDLRSYTSDLDILPPDRSCHEHDAYCHELKQTFDFSSSLPIVLLHTSMLAEVVSWTIPQMISTTLEISSTCSYITIASSVSHRHHITEKSNIPSSIHMTLNMNGTHLLSAFLPIWYLQQTSHLQICITTSLNLMWCENMWKHIVPAWFCSPLEPMHSFPSTSSLQMFHHHHYHYHYHHVGRP
jgi:hypothetical protein